MAREYLEKALLVEPKEPKIALLLGLILTDEGELERAQNLLENCGETYGFAANFPLGMIYASENRFDDALAAFKQAQKSNQSAESIYLVACACAALGKAKNSLKYL